MTTADHTHDWYTVERNRRLWWGCACGAEEPLAPPEQARALREALAGLVEAMTDLFGRVREDCDCLYCPPMRDARALLAGEETAG